MPAAVTHPEALMKNLVPSSTSSKNTVRVTAGVTLIMPPSRCFVVSRAVKARTVSSAVGSSLSGEGTSCMLSRGRVGASSPGGPEMMFCVTSWATLTVDAGAFTLNSKREARGGRQTEMLHENEMSGLSAVLRVYRDRVDTDDLNRLRYAVKSHLQVEDDVRCTV